MHKCDGPLVAGRPDCWTATGFVFRLVEIQRTHTVQLNSSWAVNYRKQIITKFEKFYIEQRNIIYISTGYIQSMFHHTESTS